MSIIFGVCVWGGGGVVYIKWHGSFSCFTWSSTAVCQSGCAHPRVCVAPDVCLCRAGFTGQNCSEGEAKRT